MTKTVAMSRAVARELIEILFTSGHEHSHVRAAIESLTNAMDEAQAEGGTVEIEIKGGDMDLPQE